MKRIKNKGFTLVELLGVITILGIIALICIPSISGLLQKAGSSFYKAMEKNVQSAGVDYYTDNKDMLPYDKGQTAIVYVGDETGSNNSLVGLSYIDEVVDRNENKCNYYGQSQLSNNKYSYVIVIKESNNKYKYTSCMHCSSDDYESSNKYCGEDYLPENNRYIKAPADYYLQISQEDYNSNELTSNGNPSTRSYFEIRKAGVRNNNGEQLVDAKGNPITEYPSSIDLIIDGKTEKEKICDNDDKTNNNPCKTGDETVFEKLNARMKGKLDTYASYLKSHSVKLKLNYKHTFKYQGKDVIREATTYVTLIKETTQKVGPVTVSINYLDAAVKDPYYTSKPKDKDKIDNTEYTYEYNIYQNNVNIEPYQQKNYIDIKDEKFENISWTNMAVKVNFSAEGSSAYECSYDNENWWPCSSGEKYNYNINKTIYVRGISLYGNKGVSNKFPVKIDINKPTCGSCSGQGSSSNWSKTRTITCGSDAKDNVSKTESGKDGNLSKSGYLKKEYSEDNKVITTTAQNYTVTDPAGNTTTCTPTVSVYVDNENPKCTSSGGSNNWTKNSVKLTGTCDDGNGSGCDGNTSSTIEYQTNSSISPGTVRDKVGNETVCPTQTVKIDKTNPKCNTNAVYENTSTVYESNNGNNPNWTNQNITLIGNCSDDFGECSSNSSQTIRKEGSTTDNPGRVCDKAGNCISCQDKTVYIDKTAPSCGGCTGESTTWVNSSRTITCGGSASDSLSGIAYKTDNQKTWNSGTVSTGTINYTVTDNAGNIKKCNKTVNVYLDKEAPSVTKVSQYDYDTCNNSCGVQMHYKVSDSGSGVALVQDYWGTSDSVFDTSFTNSLSRKGTDVITTYGTACYSSGVAATCGSEYYCKIQVCDRVGNCQQTKRGPVKAEG